MFILKKLCLCFFLFSFLSLNAQKLSDFRWERRLIILVVEKEGLPVFKDQLLELMKDKEGLVERKLMIIQLQPRQSRILFPPGEKGEIKPSLYQQFKQEKQAFSLLLIGLDGGVKLRRHEFVSREYLYALIDGMPMRRAEMRAEKNKN